MNTPIVQFHAGSPIMISGPTGSGKTLLTKKILQNNMFTKPIASILYCYGVYQELFTTMEKEIQNITFHDGLPDLKTITDLNNGDFHVIVLDDLMEYIVKSIETQTLFTTYCHHYNITAIFLTQNIFAKGPCSRTININTHILILFANKRDESQAICLGKQIYPSKVKEFMKAYMDATTIFHGYIVVDCDPKTDRVLKLRTNMFPHEDTICYIIE